ncbi:AEC family transporter [Granulicoccus phenolivorans]|uniref:AEC family transporter n=1 Tax=Granulicoccus phenolivorans TaxID=266854 RepID=UPI00041DAEA4|nr:AEC family transporter [Granulicoccus phenolivorans]
MGLLVALVNVILPVIVVAGTGFALGRFFTLDAATISKIALYALTPALCLNVLLTTQVSGQTGVAVVGAYVLVCLLGAAIAGLLTPKVAAPTRRAVMASVAIANSGNMGLPIALFALGQAGFEQSVLMFIASVVLGFIVGPLLFGASGGLKGSLIGLLKLPTLWAIVVALLMRLLGWQLPTGIMRGVEMLSNAALPIVLLSLGIQLGATKRVKLTRAVWTATLIRVLGMPFLSLGIGLLFGLRGVPLQALVLAGAMPTAVNAFLLAMEYKGDVRTTADTVTMTTILSLFSAAAVTAALPLLP